MLWSDGGAQKDCHGQRKPDPRAKSLTMLEDGGRQVEG